MPDVLIYLMEDKVFSNMICWMVGVVTGIAATCCAKMKIKERNAK